MQTFREKLDILIKNKNMTLPEVAEKAGMAPTRLYEWKHATPKLSGIERVANVLGVKVVDLLPDQYLHTEDIIEDDIFIEPDDAKSLLIRQVKDLDLTDEQYVLISHLIDNFHK
ncbi:helix-turn-helix domain-containing protein [Weissella confusa]|uniref:helix-turn-helix domain-containing protein n=1 Tax=Weissella confusa TaxID=1583 RepID=UPI00223AF063|nr:helix-turn-helix transcriptional regulator [Weissella confusa]MCS9991245.1 XRE family transcriptional regulator [Weissella confusa]